MYHEANLHLTMIPRYCFHTSRACHSKRPVAWSNTHRRNPLQYQFILSCTKIHLEIVLVPESSRAEDRTVEGQGKAEALLLPKDWAGTQELPCVAQHVGVKGIEDPKDEQQLGRREREDPAAGPVESIRSPYLLIMEPYKPSEQQAGGSGGWEKGADIHHTGSEKPPAPRGPPLLAGGTLAERRGFTVIKSSPLHISKWELSVKRFWQSSLFKCSFLLLLLFCQCPSSSWVTAGLRWVEPASDCKILQ